MQNVSKYAEFAKVAAATADPVFSWWQPTAPGDGITGKVVAYGEDAHSKFSQKVIKVEVDTGVVVGRGVNVVLAGALDELRVGIGDVISIIFRGEKMGKTATKPFKVFRVILHERADAGIPF